ncbi:hypothetical protein GOODEAATRI_007751 [Goodea atripinnis]|uniref:Nuclear/hormone receptor activator site AF-1 domain-containing protein n=1 Tax=Goodea atripinnis TaxID=208336 RepID=A0ABV0MQ64_9TELE
MTLALSPSLSTNLLQVYSWVVLQGHVFPFSRVYNPTRRPHALHRFTKLYHKKYLDSVIFLNNIPFYFFQPDSSGHVTSSPLGSPTSHRGMHPSLLSPTSMGPSGSLHSPISTLSSPMNGLTSPFSVISSPMGPHSMNSPGMGYGPSISPQVRPQAAN